MTFKQGFKRASGYVEPKIAGIELFNSSETDMCSSFWTTACGRVKLCAKGEQHTGKNKTANRSDNA